MVISGRPGFERLHDPQMALVVKNPPAKAGDLRDVGLIPGFGRSSREGHGCPLQYSCLENSMDREAWGAAVLGVQRVGHEQVTNYMARSVSDIGALQLAPL